MIRVHVEAGKNTNSVMGRIRVEAMKSHALADRARVETMATSILEKSPISCGFAENGGYVSADEEVEANEAKI